MLSSDFSGRIVVIGDVMLDKLTQGKASRLSPEAPVPVLHATTTHHCLGGAGNVAQNLSQLGAHVTLIGLVGMDEAAKTLDELMTAGNIHNGCVATSAAPTIVKHRLMAEQQQLLRVDTESVFSPEADFYESVKAALPTASAVVLSDYGKGTLKAVQTIIELANQYQVPVLVDPKHPDLTVYRGATAITPNWKEFLVHLKQHGQTESQWQSAATALLSEAELTHLIVTQGAKGMTLFSHDHAPAHLPAQAREVYDVTGAGDTVIAVLALALAQKLPMLDAVKLANTAAGLVVQRIGTAAITLPELEAVQKTETWSSHHKCPTLPQCLAQVLSLKTQGQRIVFTNGCFDILHPGHVTLLNEAKACGDFLIVAVNSDASVARLKGPERPVHPLTHRMAVLAGLEAVDAVVSFEEDTPIEVIQCLLPDILVKGGDYTPDEVVGKAVVEAQGGVVKIIPSVKGYATTHSVEKMRASVQHTSD